MPNRSTSRLCGALLIAGMVLACQRSSDWNDVFHRSEGWWYSDGGSSAELSNGKTVWLFGDTWIRHKHGLLFNTIAVSDTEPGRAPRGDEIRFFARDESRELVDVSQTGWRAIRPWVSPRGDARNTWLWPSDVAVSDGKLVAIYIEVGCVQGDFPLCRRFLGNMDFMGHTAVVVDNPEEEPERWRVRTTPLVDRRGRPPSARRLHWGSALLEDAGWLYIFGTGLSPESAPSDVKMARVVPRDLGRYDLWQFLTADGWRMFPTGPGRTDLQSIAQGGSTELSVDRVIRDGQTWLVMVQVDALSREVVVRSSPASDIESTRWAGPDAGPGVRRFSLRLLDPETAGGMSWAGRAHLHHSPSKETLLVSYFSERVHSLRFVELPLSELLDGW